MSYLKGLLLDIANENKGYRTDKPWRYHAQSTAAIVPIIRESFAKEPSYRLLSENTVGVTICDTGSINQLSVTNKSQEVILIKAGTYVSGSTQTRMFTLSQIVFPGENVLAPCACVYASKGIVKNASVKVEGFAPVSVRYNIHNNNKTHTPNRYSSEPDSSSNTQSTVWNSVNKYGREETVRLQYIKQLLAEYPDDPKFKWLYNMENRYNSSSDNLAGMVNENRNKMSEPIAEVPDYPGQVGMVLVAPNGISSFECFDQSSIWYILRPKFLSAEAGSIVNLGAKGIDIEYFTNQTTNMLQQILVADFKEQVVVNKGNTQTIKVDVGGYKAELVVLNGDVISCSIVMATKL